MRLSIRHETHYRYSAPISYVSQLIRLTPKPVGGMTIRRWSVSTSVPTDLPLGDDPYGNLFHLNTVTQPIDVLSIYAEGVVETTRSTFVNDPADRMPPGLFLRHTRLTEPTPALKELAESASGTGNRDLVMRLAEAVHGRVVFRHGVTATATTAHEALEAGAGVCQDHAHVMLACARMLGIPSRYVSGYLWTETGAQASHAWVEAYLPNEGWFGIDPANNTPVTDAHVRVAVGLDYESAGPLRGIRQGLAAETLETSIRVDRLDHAPAPSI